MEFEELPSEFKRIENAVGRASSSEISSSGRTTGRKSPVSGQMAKRKKSGGNLK